LTATPALVTKFELIESSVAGEVLERNREIHCALNALISRKHFFMIGPPGTAKSFMVRRIVDRIDFSKEANANEAYFQWLLTKYTTPEEVFGPPSLADLEEGRYRRNTERKLPRAYVAFLDETFKANSSILNALLTIMNERQFFNNDDDSSTPVSSIFAASNEMPMDDNLWALWDRLHFRFKVEPVRESGNFIAMLRTPRNPNPDKLLTWAEIRQAQTEAAGVELPPDLFDALKMLRDNLRNEGIEPTERRFVESLGIIQAEAWMNGRDVADIDDMRVLRHVLWSDEEQIRQVERMVLELANPLDKEAHDLLERVDALDAELAKAVRDADTPKAVAKQAVEIHAKLHKAKTRMDDLEKRAQENGRQSDVLAQLQGRFVEVAKRLMSQGFGLPGDDA
jgi:MoxR-like ATPase